MPLREFFGFSNPFHQRVLLPPLTLSLFGRSEAGKQHSGRE
jgi:hypothetical protein